ncbi:hypothetical protein L0128_18615 [candidate division KSB1 bacterium]|nr:hypothetical protein [candidate division KSB1 bacterium]
MERFSNHHFDWIEQIPATSPTWLAEIEKILNASCSWGVELKQCNPQTGDFVLLLQGKLQQNSPN